MSKVLVVEPSKMLQHAFVHALFPDHAVEIVADMEAAAEHAGDADVAIIDAAMLRERAAGSGAAIQAPRDWNIPTIWVDAAPPGAKCPSGLNLSMPFSREELRSALARIGPARQSHAAPGPAGDSAALPRARRGRKPPPAAADGDAKNVIELVDVYDEPDVPAGARADTDSGNE